MATIKNLDKNLVKKDDRFTFIEDYGDGWRNFGYKELCLETKRTGGKTYLTIRFDWDKYAFTSAEWRATAESELTHLFYGVDEINLERLVCICDKVINGIYRLNDEVKDEVLDLDPVAEKLREEIAEADKAIEVGKAMDWWNLKDYDLKWASHAIRFLERDRNDAVKLLGTMVDLPRDAKKELLERLDNGKYIEVRTHYIEEVYEYVEMCKEV